MSKQVSYPAKPFDETSLKCDLCSFTAYQINDPTQEEMIGTKRDVTLVKTSSLSEPPKKKMAVEEKSQDEEIELEERSKLVDAKILKKRRKDEEEEERQKALIDLKEKEIKEFEKKSKNKGEVKRKIYTKWTK